MTRSDQRLVYLYRQYISKRCTKEELEEFLGYVRDQAYRETLEAMTDQDLETMDISADLPVIDWEHMYRTVMPHPETKRQERRAPIFTLARVAAAACIILIGIGVYLFFTKGHQGHDQPLQDLTAKDITPGYNKAILTLSSGASIVLDSAHTGTLTNEGDASVVNSTNGTLAYNVLNGSGGSPTKRVYNTLTTPRGGQYQLLLPDGTRVWLNAASSITYPTAFTGNDRSVQITGEAYFEVIHDGKKPFSVRAGSQIIEDIGTHFNVNVYTDEPALVTTLLEGAVKIGPHILKPGEQASTGAAGGIVVSKGDPQQAVAWKNGFFDFTDANLQTVMRQLGRWYNIEVQYEGNIPERRFNGMIGRTLTLEQVLKGLTREHVHYHLADNNHLIITP